MNKWVALVLAFFFGLGVLNAQQRFYPSRPRNDAAMYEGPVYGMKVGVNLPRLYYSNPYLGSLSHDLMATPSVSLFMERPLVKTCTYAFELNYQQRGGSFTYKRSGIKEIYCVNAQYLAFRVPVYYYTPISDLVKPYVFITPDAAFTFGGKISLTHPGKEIPNQSTSTNYSNINFLYLGAVGGMGIRFNIPLSMITIVVKADVAMNFGLTDTYSKFEQSGASQSINGVHNYNINSKRSYRGLEMHLGLGFFFNKHNACSTFQ